MRKPNVWAWGALAVLAWVFALGCEDYGKSSFQTKVSNGEGEGSITRYHDDEKNVTCWVLIGYQKGAISCIPDNQLRPDIEKKPAANYHSPYDMYDRKKMESTYAQYVEKKR